MNQIDSEWKLFLQDHDSSIIHEPYSLGEHSDDHTSNDSDSYYEDDHSTTHDDPYGMEASYQKGLITASNYYANTAANQTIYHNTTTEPGTSTTTEKTMIPAQRGQCEDLYISTQTKIFFLNLHDIDVDRLFWNIPVMSYTVAQNGVIKKQMRLISKTREEYDAYLAKRNKENYYTEKIIKQIDNPNARKIKFKDVRKLTVGISKKDIMNCHGKNKNAFINCFAMILRIKNEDKFHEIHVKVFNTGRMAIPGIVNEALLEKTKEVLLNILQQNFTETLKLIPEEDSPEVQRLVKGKLNKETNKKEKSYFEKVKPKSNVLINSNFNCGYYIQQDKLREILRDKYNLHPVYDPSMYPGVKCKFYYNNELPHDSSIQLGILDEKDQHATMMELDELTLDKYTKISFMVFRTGNCLIVGNCTKEILTYVYEFVKKILMDEYDTIHASQDVPITKIKKTKPRKHNVRFTPEYYKDLLNSQKSI